MTQRTMRGFAGYKARSHTLFHLLLAETLVRFESSRYYCYRPFILLDFIL